MSTDQPLFDESPEASALAAAPTSPDAPTRRETSRRETSRALTSLDVGEDVLTRLRSGLGPVADEAVARALEGLGTDHTSRTLREMRDLTPKALRRAYRAFVGPDDDQWTVIVVGEAKALTKPLAKLAKKRGMGAVRVVDAAPQLPPG